MVKRRLKWIHVRDSIWRWLFWWKCVERLIFIISQIWNYLMRYLKSIFMDSSHIYNEILCIYLSLTNISSFTLNLCCVLSILRYVFPQIVTFLKLSCILNKWPFTITIGLSQSLVLIEEVCVCFCQSSQTPSLMVRQLWIQIVVKWLLDFSGSVNWLP